MLAITLILPVVSATDERPVYIMSDRIHNNAADNARINTVVNELKNAGVKKVYNAGVGKNNYAILRETPSNAIIIQIMGGTCAATIYSMAIEGYYNNLRGTRTVIPVWVPPATNIAGLSWIGRSCDDGGHGSFSGISYPAKTLENAGYNWYYWKTNNDLNKITNDVSVKAGVTQKKPNSGTKVKPPASTVIIGGCKVYTEFPSTYPLRYGIKNGKYIYSNNKYVKVTQIQLYKKVGYDGYCRGNFGPKTKMYVLKFQKKEKLPQTGKVDKKTWKALIK